MGVIQTSIFAFLLHEQPFERFRFARWQSVVAITLLGIEALSRYIVDEVR